MEKGNLSREEAVEIVGVEAVNSVDAMPCEPTGRVGYNGACQGDALCEWIACADAVDKDGNECVVVAYYYTTNDDDQAMADADGDGSAINWKIAGYEVA